MEKVMEAIAFVLPGLILWILLCIFLLIWEIVDRIKKWRNGKHSEKEILTKKGGLKIMKPGLITLRFIGTDGSMGLRKGQAYMVRIYTKFGRIVVSWGVGENEVCPYSSLKTLCENWESVA